MMIEIFVISSFRFMTFFRTRHILMTIRECSSLTLNENRHKLSDCCIVTFFCCHSIAWAVVTNLWQIKFVTSWTPLFFYKKYKKYYRAEPHVRVGSIFSFLFVEEIRACGSHLSFIFFLKKFGYIEPASQNWVKNCKITFRLQDLVRTTIKASRCLCLLWYIYIFVI